MPGVLKRLKCKPTGPRAKKRFKGTKTRTVSLRPDGGFVVTSGKYKGRRCSIRNQAQDDKRKAIRTPAKRLVKGPHRHQGDMKKKRQTRKDGTKAWI